MCVCVYLSIYIYWLIDWLIDCWFIAVYYYRLGGWNERLGRYIRFVPNRATGSPAELWIEFPKNLGNLNSSPVLFIHPYDVRVFQMCKFDDTWMTTTTKLIYVRDFCRFINEKNGICCLKKTFFSPANILCWTKKNEECDSHMMSPESWGCCQPKWSNIQQVLFLMFFTWVFFSVVFWF